MAAKKRTNPAAARAAGTAAARVALAAAPAPVVGELTGRYAQLVAEHQAAGMAIEPYVITTDLVIYPPTPARKQAMDEAQGSKLLAQTVVASLVSTMGDAPEDLDERTVWATKQREALQNAYDQIDAADEAYNVAFYGGADVLARVDAFFEGQSYDMKTVFVNDITQKFRRLLPDGRCKYCGLDADPAEGEGGGGSSTTSSTTGASSKGISPDTSTEPTPETGSPVDGPGPSS